MTLLELLQKLDPNEQIIYAVLDKDGYFQPHLEARYSRSCFAGSKRFLTVKEVLLRQSVGHTPTDMIQYTNSLPKQSLRYAKNWRIKHPEAVAAYETSAARREAKKLHARAKRAQLKQEVVPIEQ